MDFQDMVYAVDTPMSVDAATVSVLAAVEKAGWSVFAVHDVAERLAAKGFAQKPLKIIEICSGKYANEFLNQNRLSSLCMPCKINVFEKDGKTVVAALNPVVAAEFFPGVSAETAKAAAKDLRAIVDAAVA